MSLSALKQTITERYQKREMLLKLSLYFALFSPSILIAGKLLNSLPLFGAFKLIPIIAPFINPVGFTVIGLTIAGLLITTLVYSIKNALDSHKLTTLEHHDKSIEEQNEEFNITNTAISALRNKINQLIDYEATRQGQAELHLNDDKKINTSNSSLKQTFFYYKLLPTEGANFDHDSAEYDHSMTASRYVAL